MFRALPIATFLLIAINLVVFILMLGKDPSGWTASYLSSWGANNGERVFQGEVWRLFTAMFIHVGFVHIGMNMLVLYAWGRPVESILGTIPYTSIYVVSGLAGSLLGALVHPYTVSAGASGAIAGILGVMCVLAMHGGYNISRNDVIGNLLLNGVLSLLPGVDAAAHIGGFAGGCVITFIALASDWLPEPPPRVEEEAALPIQGKPPTIQFSFREPMSFPKGTTVYETKTGLVAVLPDYSLIQALGDAGLQFESAAAFREQTHDNDIWKTVKTFE